MAIVLGAHFNASIQSLWPVPLRDRRNRLARATEKVSAAPGDGAAAPGSGIAAATGSVVPDELPDVLLSPDVAVLERAVRERPDVAAAVLDQMRYGQLRPAAPHDDEVRARNGAGEPRDGHAQQEPGDGSGDGTVPPTTGARTGWVVIAADGRRRGDARRGDAIVGTRARPGRTS